MIENPLYKSLLLGILPTEEILTPALSLKIGNLSLF